MVSSKLNNRRKNINGFGLAILLCANPLSWIFPVNNIIVYYSLISLIIVLFNNPITSFINSKLWVILGVLTLFTSSYLFANIDQRLFFLYFYSFLTFGVTGLLYSNVQFSFSALFKTIFGIAVLSVPGIYREATTDYSRMGDMSGVWMGVSQGALRLVLGIIVVIPLLNSRIFKYISFATILVYSSFFIAYGNRGSFLALILFLIFLGLNGAKKLNVKNFVLLALLGGLLSFFFIDVIQLIIDFFLVFDIEIGALEKIIRFDRLGKELTNGRNLIWEKALVDIVDNPIYGHGVSAFINKYGVYPHNFLLEMFFEGGLIYLTPVLWVFYRFFKLLFSNDISSEEKKILVFIFCAGIMEVAFSNVYWRNMFFWFFIGYTLNLKKKPAISYE